MLFRTIKKNNVAIFYSDLKAAIDKKSAYEKASLTVQTTIRALQDKNPFAKCWQIILSRSKVIFIGVFNARIASIKSHSFEKY